MKRVILDANLVVLLVVGNVGRDRISHHKRLSAYQPVDWDILIDVLSDYDQIIVTPNILTEASNLIRSGDKANQAQFSAAFSALVADSSENYVRSVDAVFHPLFPNLGLTDAACLRIGGDVPTILTADVGLYVAALREGLPAENFNHSRDPI